MADLRDYKNKDFSVTINKRMNGIEIRYAAEMSDEQVAEIKEAGFKWSRRQQLWYAYQNEKSIEYVNSIKSASINETKTEESLKETLRPETDEPAKIISSGKIENKMVEITIDDLLAMVKQRAELDRKIAAVKNVLSADGRKIDVSSEQAKHFALAMRSLETDVEENVKETNKGIQQENIVLKTYHTLKQEEINGLEEITQEAFNNIVDSLYEQPNPDYKNIPNLIKLPQLNKELAQKLGVENANFFMKSKVAHVRPNRKGEYNQDLRIEEMKGLLDFIKTCKISYIDTTERHQNFVLAGIDELNSKKSNKVVFNKDELGNYIVTIGKVDTSDFNGKEYSKVAVGLAPTIWRSQKENSLSTTLTPSTTSPTDSVSQNENLSNKLANQENNESTEKTKSVNKDSELTVGDLDVAKSFIPPMEYATLLESATHGEEKEHFSERIKHIADMGKQLYKNRNGKSYNKETGVHDKGFIHYFLGNSDWYISEIDENNIAFGYAVLNGDTETAEFGEIDLNELRSLKLNGIIEPEVDLYINDSQSMEQAICDNYPELKSSLLPHRVIQEEQPVNEKLTDKTEENKVEEEKRPDWQHPETLTDKELESFLDGAKEDLAYQEYQLKNGWGNYTTKGEIQGARELIQELEKEQHKREQEVSPEKDIFTDEHHTPSQAKEIREEVKNILDNNTDEEISKNSEYLELLAQYEGGGGLNNEEGRSNAEVLNAFYTPRSVVNAVWELADHFVPNAKTVLEPSSGIGRFAENHDNEKEFTMRELDPISARIAKILHPNANVIQGAFQQQFFDSTGRVHNSKTELPKYDLVIGNPPYGVYNNEWKGRGEGKEHNKIEEYFIEKGLDSLKNEKSVLAYVLPSGWLRSRNSKIKELIAGKGQIIDAYRLPNKAFDTTDIGTDIVLLKKNTIENHSEELKKNIESFSNDIFFKSHPEKILGEPGTRSGRFGEEPCVNLPANTTLEDELAKIHEQLTANTLSADKIEETVVIKNKDEKKYVHFEQTKTKTIHKESSLQQTVPEQKKPLTENSPVMTSEDFSKLYGKHFEKDDIPIWKATNWEGIIDRSKLSFEEENKLHSNPNYIEVEPGKFTHKVLFESGDIAEKKQHYENEINKYEASVKEFDGRIYNDDKGIWEDADPAKLELYRKNLEILERISPEPIPMEKLHFGVLSSLAEEFEVEQINEEGNVKKINLQESFILWATGNTLQSAYSNNSRYWRGGIDFTTANISEEDFPPDVQWRDIIDYIDKKPVKADKVTGSWRKEESEINAEKAQHKKEAEEKRMARSETADKLFDKYLHEGLSDKLKAQVQAEYNRRFNSYIIPDYSKLPLFISGMSRTKGSKNFKLYDQQIKGVSFLSNKGNGLLAYDVGVGKTATGIVANVCQMETGRSKKPLIVVPNSVYSKWLKDITELFPNVKVNDLYNLNKESASKFRNSENPHKLNIPENSISLVTYEALKNITFNDSSCENELFEDFSKLLSEDFDGSAVENSKNADKIKGQIGEASQVKNENFVFFEDCGWDNITVDEAHNFKNLWTVPKPKTKGQSNEFAGIPSGKPSSRALKLYAMTQLTQRHNEDRNVFLLTATPFTNSPLEVYSMLSYVGRKRLINSGLYSLRDFCNEFAHTKLELGVNSKGEIDQKQVMKDWKELPALQKILTEFIDKVDGEELKEIIRPKKFTHVQPLEMSDLQKRMMEIDTIKMSEIKEGNSAAIITAMNAMRLALVAPALADPVRYCDFDIKIPPMNQLVETSPKLKFVCDSIINMYKNNPEKGQFLYLPLGKESHGIIKDYLTNHGIPKEAVEIINGEINNTTDKKYKVTGKFNNPKEKCKILIGGKNTSEGIDLNGNSFVMYNCSLGWNPSETIQAEGRIWRQGNQQGHVHCCYPVMNDSIDSVLYQKHDEKRSRINELFNYKDGDTLNVEDISPEDLKFDLIKDPKKRSKMIMEQGIIEKDEKGNVIFKFEGTNKIQNELNKVESRLKSFDEVYEKRISLKKHLEETNNEIAGLEKNIEDCKDKNLEIPTWCKEELKDNRKYKESYERQLDTITRKFSTWGIKTEENLNNFIPNLNKRKHDLEKELKEMKDELPKILEHETVKMMEKKILLPPVEQQQKIFIEDIQNNLRPMTEVEPEIRTQRFEEMLEKKWQKGEITSEEKETYSLAGYKKYYAWLDGETESLESPNTTEQEQNIQKEAQEPVSNTENKVTDTANEIIAEPAEIKKETVLSSKENTYSEPEVGWLFADEEIKPQIVIQQKNVHQLITFDSENNLVDEKNEYSTLSEAQKEGRKWLKEWNLEKENAGWAVYNKKSKIIESIHGLFPVEQAFSNEVLKVNGYQVTDETKEINISDIQQQVKDKITEQTNASKEWTEQHLIIDVQKNNKVNEPKGRER